jgi:hypothetical protein
MTVWRGGDQVVNPVRPLPGYRRIQAERAISPHQFPVVAGLKEIDAIDPGRCRDRAVPAVAFGEGTQGYVKIALCVGSVAVRDGPCQDHIVCRIVALSNWSGWS